jgi:exonuclease SbcC
MHIQRVQLRNIGPHRDFSTELGCGLIGVVGANGSGKSTLVNSIYAALTNDFSRFSSVKSDLISLGSGTEPSFIRLEGTHRGQEFVLTRWLRPSKNEFRIGTRDYTKANDVNDAVAAELNITKAVIDKYVFVDQWQMFGFLNDTASERAKAFQFLCGTEVAGQIHKTCLDYIARQQGIEIIDNRTELEQAIADAKQSMLANRKKKATYEKRILTEAEAEPYRQQVRDHRTALAAQEECRKLVPWLASRKRRYQEQESEQAETETKLLRREEWLKSRRKRVAQARASLQSARARQRAVQARDAARGELETAIAEEAAVVLEISQRSPDAELYIDATSRQMLQETADSLRASVAADQLAKVDNAVCGQCQQPISVDYRQEIRKRLKLNQELLKRMRQSLEYSQRFDSEQAELFRQQQALTAAITDHRQRLALAEQTLEAMGEAVDEQAARELVTKYEAVEEQTDKLRRKVKAGNNDVLQTKQELQQFQEQLDRQQELVNLLPTEETLNVARERLAESQMASTRRAEAVGAYREAKRTREQAEATLAQLTLRLSEKAKIRNLIETVSAVANVFHWNQLPKAVSQANLELLVDDINDNLRLFNNPFAVEADGDLTFKVFFPGQPPVKARQLSGGQKVILAIAFRAALDRVFGHDVGMLFLDEPTAGLDTDNVQFFHEALAQLASKAGQDRQLVVITHVQELGAVFDQLIEVKKV